MKELGTLFLAIIGTTLGVWNFISNRKRSTKDTALEVEAILDRVIDLLGGREGTPYLRTDGVRDRYTIAKVDRLIKRALILDPKSSSAYCCGGNRNYLKGLIDPAISDYRKAIELGPDS